MIDRLTAAPGSTQDLALTRRSKTESRDFFRLGSIPKYKDNDIGDDDFFGEELESGFKEIGEFGKGRRYDADAVFGRAASRGNPYGIPRPSATYHSEFPEGSGVGDNPNNEQEEEWMKELNKLIYEEQYTEMGLGELDENMTRVNIQKEDMDAYMKEKQMTKKWNLLARENEHELEREEKEDELLEMIKRGDDPNQEAFGPWYVRFCCRLQNF